MADSHDRDDDTLQAIARSILDGERVDWTHPPHGSDAELIEELKIVAAIAGVHRTPLSADESESPRAWGHLTIRERLGKGTSAEVFLAVDNRLQREVALKLLFPATRPVPARVAVEEACLLAKIRHPNVVTVYGAETIDGRTGIITEYVDGVTLADLLREQGPFGAQEAITIGVELCRALSAVHGAGLVHRDVKAHNVMRERGGRIVLMDLGAGSRSGADRTALAGTPLYAAPEVLAGGEATPQSDLYSLGVLLFHLVTQRYPVSGERVAAIRDAHAAGQRTLVQDVRPGLFPAFTAVIAKALSPTPSGRYQTAGEMKAALLDALSPTSTSPRDVPRGRSRIRNAAIATAALIVTAAIAWNAWRVTSPGASTLSFEPRDWVLIAAFENQSGNPRFDDALEHAFTHELGNSPHLNVAPPERVDDALLLMKRAPGTRVDRGLAREVALRDGDIRFVLAGTIGRFGDTYPVLLAIIDPATGASLASRRVEATGESGIPDAVTELSNWARATLGEAPAQIDRGGRELEPVTTPSLEALRSYSDAFRASKRRDWPAAAALLEAAVQSDPDFASAHIWLAWARSNLGDRARALAAARQATALASSASPRERHFILGSAHMIEGRLEAAAGEFEALLRVHPDDYWGQDKIVQVYNRLGRSLQSHERAVAIARMRPVDPRSIMLLAYDALSRTGVDAARSHLARASDVLTSGDAPSVPENWQSFVRLFPVHDLWSQGQSSKAAQELAAIEADPRTAAGGQWGRHSLAIMHLTLGELKKAAEAAARVPAGPLPDLPMIAAALVALAGENPAGVIQALRDYSGNDLAGVSLLIRAGDLDRAARLLGGMSASHGAHLTYAKTELEVVRTGTPEAIAALEGGLRDLEFSGVRRFLYADTLATALAARGDLGRAIQVREEQADRPHRLHTQGVHLGSLWLRNHMALARLYRKTGRTADAARVEGELSRALAAADTNHPILLALRSR